MILSLSASSRPTIIPTTIPSPRDPGRLAEQFFRTPGRGERDIRQLLGGRLDRDGAVGEHQGPHTATVALRHHHEEKTRRRADVLGQPDAEQPSLDHPPGRRF